MYKSNEERLVYKNLTQQLADSKIAHASIRNCEVIILAHDADEFFALDVIWFHVRELRRRIRAISMQQRAARTQSSRHV
jgi:hypothetical protein